MNYIVVIKRYSCVLLRQRPLSLMYSKSGITQSLTTQYTRQCLRTEGPDIESLPTVLCFTCNKKPSVENKIQPPLVVNQDMIFRLIITCANTQPMNKIKLNQDPIHLLLWQIFTQNQKLNQHSPKPKWPSSLLATLSSKISEQCTQHSLAFISL